MASTRPSPKRDGAVTVTVSVAAGGTDSLSTPVADKSGGRFALDVVAADILEQIATTIHVSRCLENERWPGAATRRLIVTGDTPRLIEQRPKPLLGGCETVKYSFAEQESPAFRLANRGKADRRARLPRDRLRRYGTM